MVIDLTRRPVVINTDICLKWVIVRTASNREVRGTLQREYEGTRHPSEKSIGNKFIELTPGATRVLGEMIYLESRLIPTRRTKNYPLCAPYEVATVYVDSYTRRRGTWRAQVTLEDAKANWIVSVRDEGSKVDLVMATVKTLEEREEMDHNDSILQLRGPIKPQDEVFPLNRIDKDQTPIKPMSIWERIRNITYGPEGYDD
jgi:hypothetical protein